jgi:hypothetical protein
MPENGASTASAPASKAHAGPIRQGLLLRRNRRSRIGPVRPGLRSSALVSSEMPVLSHMVPQQPHCNRPRSAGQMPCGNPSEASQCRAALMARHRTGLRCESLFSISCDNPRPGTASPADDIIRSTICQCCHVSAQRGHAARWRLSASRSLGVATPSSSNDINRVYDSCNSAPRLEFRCLQHLNCSISRYASGDRELQPA